MSGDSDERAEKLAGRWGEDETEPDSEVSQNVEESVAESEETESTADRDASETEDGGLGELTTREMKSQMLYLDPELYRELDLTFEELKLRYRRERDDKLQKNKDFYAGLLRLGLAQLGDVRERNIEEIEDDLDL